MQLNWGDVMKILNRLLYSASCSLVDFDHNDIVPGFVRDSLFLLVSGEKPFRSMEVKLVPSFFDQHFDYWRINVVGFYSEIDQRISYSYFTSICLEGIIGNKGIELVGANHSVKIPRKDFMSSEVAEILTQ
ncbi:MAG: hypothetical protein D3922_17260 [Candidatus Electrothrix sp. AR1]|nr:hypothetical protein [Candidatus Electrothrix sp. AR1]